MSNLITSQQKQFIESDFTEAELAALYILDSLRRVNHDVGRRHLAKLLEGNEEMEKCDCRTNRHIGKLSKYNRDEIVWMIDQLIGLRYVNYIDGDNPVINLSDSGDKAVRDRTHITLKLPRREDAKPEKKTVSRAYRLPGPWDTGWSLGHHSWFKGEERKHTKVGKLVYTLKYQGDCSATMPLVWLILALIEEHPELKQIDVIVPIPSSTKRDLEPVSEVARGLSNSIGVPVKHAVVRTRRTHPQKDMQTAAQKKANVAGVFAVDGDVAGLRVLLLDDLYDSGATFVEITKVLKAAGVSKIAVLALSSTIHKDR